MNKSMKNILRVLILLSFAAALAACGQVPTPEPTQDLEVIEATAMQKAFMSFTETAAAMPTDTPTPAPTYTPASIPATATSAAVVELPPAEGIVRSDTADAAGIAEQPTASIGELPTAVVPTATLYSSGDKASYDSMNPVDGTHLTAGQVFDVNWFLLNSGITTWTREYSVRFFTGTNFCKPGKDRYYLNNPVAPNTVGQVSIDAVAPSKPGTYTMCVVLGNEMDENFYAMDITIVVD